MDHSDDPCCTHGVTTRADVLGHALRLEYLTVAWNLVEGAVAVSSAVVAGSVALLAFGIDSFVESAAGLVMIWRLATERRGGLSGQQLDALEGRARRLVAGSLLLLGAYVAFDALWTLWNEERPAFSGIGIILTLISIVVMAWLAHAKRRAAARLGSAAMHADASQTTACWWLSGAALLGVGLNGLFGWWWADPVAALVIAGLVVHEAREAWVGGRGCCY